MKTITIKNKQLLNRIEQITITALLIYSYVRVLFFIVGIDL